MSVSQVWSLTAGVQVQWVFSYIRHPNTHNSSSSASVFITHILKTNAVSLDTLALPANDHSYCSSYDSLSPPSPLMPLLFFSVPPSPSLSLSFLFSLCRLVWLLCRVAPWRLGHCSAVVFAHLTFLIAASFSPQSAFLFPPPLPTLSLFYLTPCLSK